MCGPGGSGADLLPPAPREQGSGQEARQRAGPGHGPGCLAEAGRLQAARCAPCVAPAALVLVYSPLASRGQGDGQEARQQADPGHGPDVRHRPDSS